LEALENGEEPEAEAMAPELTHNFSIEYNQYVINDCVFPI
jgi:hypothetical protein